MVVLCGIEVVWEKPMEEPRDLPVGMRVGCVKQSPGESLSGRWSSVLRESQVETALPFATSPWKSCSGT